MTYRLKHQSLPELPRRCPVCDGKRADPEAVKVHNIIAAATGCRRYPNA